MKLHMSIAAACFIRMRGVIGLCVRSRPPRCPSRIVDWLVGYTHSLPDPTHIGAMEGYSRMKFAGLNKIAVSTRHSPLCRCNCQSGLISAEWFII